LNSSTLGQSSAEAGTSESTVDRRLEGWSLLHAGVMIAAALAVTATGMSWPLGACAGLTFAGLIAVHRGAWTAQLVFGWANWVTLLRLSLTLAVSFALHTASGEVLAAVLMGIFALDGVDGWLARRCRLTSQFGAHFDMEADALFVLVATEGLWLRHQTGLWILLPGWLRYVYVVYKAIIPAGAESMPRTKWGRGAFAVLASGIPLAFLFPYPWSSRVVLPGAVLVSLSFGYSFRWTWLRAMKS
jgi:phosphatidylglycerophosphate synthase